MGIGIGPRLWTPQYRSGGIEIATTVVQATVADPLSLDGTTIPFNSLTGNILVRMIGRAAKAARPLTINVAWGGKPLVQKTFFAENGAGGTFVGEWTLAGQTPATANLVITCGTGNAGVTAIRAGEIGGTPVQVAAASIGGPVLPMGKAPANALLVVGGYADAAADPLSSINLDAQWVVKIPPNTVLPNRHAGLAGFFGITYTNSPDGNYRIKTNTQVVSIAGAIAGLELKL